MKKIFISQPMNGLSEEQIKSDRNTAIMIMQNYFDGKVEVVNASVENPPKKANPLWFLGKSLEALSTADVAVFLRGWEKYRGCRLEHTCAVEYGIRIIEL